MPNLSSVNATLQYYVFAILCFCHQIITSLIAFTRSSVIYIILYFPDNCPIIQPTLNNARVVSSGSTVGSVAIAECNEGSEMIGSQVRYCLHDARWSGNPPSCIGMNVVL